MIKKIAIGITLFILLGFTLANNFRELVLGKLENYAANYPEKIYVQTDKPYYTTGEDIWYTAYLVNGISHQKSDLSRVLYVELVNEKDSIVSKRQLYTEDVSVAGDFKINKDWKSGKYLLRAYTNHMRNDDADYFFQTQIPIWNVSEHDTLNKKSKVLSNTSFSTKKGAVTPPEIGFYPESGYLVNGLNTKVGIKIKDQAYHDIELKGNIKDSNNNVVSTFATYKFGLSVASLLPEAGKTYYASIMFNGEEVKYPLPEALPSGYNLNMINSGNQIIVQASSNTGIGLKNTFLVAHQRGHLIYERLETDDKNNYKVKINTAALKNGVVSFTLFNSSGNPVCERLVYVDNQNDNANIKVTLDNEAPKTRDKVSMQIDLTDKTGQPLSGNLSMSITDIDAVGQSAQSENIKTYLLLNSDLRGRIEDPGYFFQKENDIKRRYLLDVLMLTHGWRRFTWNDLLYKPPTKNRFNPEKGILISGNTSSLNGNKQPIPTTTRITLMGGLPYQEKKQTDVKGVFNYGPFVFNDTLPILLEARVKDFKSDNDKKNRLVSIALNNTNFASPKITRNDVLKSTLLDSSKINSFLQQAKNIFQIDVEFAKSARVLDEIVITAQKETEEEQREQELNDRTDYGYASKRLDMKSLENQSHLSIFDLLNMLPGVTTLNDSIYVRNETPAVYLDGFQVELIDISHLTGSDIDFIDVLSGAEASSFSNAGNGVVAIYSRTGANISVRNVKRKPGIIDFEAIGFYTAREFYAPDHLNGFEEAMKADIRTTLHWEPKIVLNENNTKAEVSFFTSDKKSNYAIKIEGITDSGIPVYHLSTLEVD
ncbi:hypothetical protein FPF71_05070 [Algibacter amylolyticus]|uniref:TonB-dependent receptor plug domain-containing protein n=1 Tax=Algibacter amylolyticus TaxID=1608400 RepID=A0A5M7BG11_9FLAO|nr:hypothetical protein [Algibacter amylolyticus]KAA5826185.1 hypothetical protein F2B50_05070 [Algibacter amylolyticus]MBB5268386.1 hypothetical protein [Algibacter amylolyticus]TSJ80223.1 hypothetical protein FPF71_05070 [Algibacter amylolyticus]